MNVSALTPPEIDRLYVEANRTEARAQQGLAVAYHRLHDALGERRGRGRYVGRKYVDGDWPTTDEAAVKAAEAALVDSDAPGYRVYAVRQALEGLAEASAAARAAGEAFAPLDAEWKRRGGWSRFFIVEHIHSSMSCSTCNRNGQLTKFGWLPDLSGLTEEDAVKEHGTILCSVCFPSAPVEWTVGKQAPEGCSGKLPVEGSVVRRGMKAYGECPVCHTRQIITNSGLRKHKPQN